MEKTLEVLRTVRACEEEAGHSRALDWSLVALQRRVRLCAGQGLLVVADRETRAELSAWEGRPVRWAVRLSEIGRDVIAFARSQPAPAPPEPSADARLVELLPSQMAVLQMYIGLLRAGEISARSAEGLAEQVRDAVSRPRGGPVAYTPERRSDAVGGVRVLADPDERLGGRSPPLQPRLRPGLPP